MTIKNSRPAISQGSQRGSLGAALRLRRRDSLAATRDTGGTSAGGSEACMRSVVACRSQRAPRSVAKAAIESYRSSMLRAIALRQTAVTSAPISGRHSAGERGVALMTCARILAVVPSNGLRLVNNSYSSTPRL